MVANEKASKLTVLDTMNDLKLFGEQFEGESWRSWSVFLAALFGLPLSDSGLEVFRQCTGRDVQQAGPYNEAYAVVGRRGGKRSGGCRSSRSLTSRTSARASRTTK
jgi:hypothetical protein